MNCFNRRIMNSVDASEIDVCDLRWLRLNWVRPYHKPWAASLRSPTIGSLLEFTTRCEVDSVPVDSPAARRLYRTLAVR